MVTLGAELDRIQARLNDPDGRIWTRADLRCVWQDGYREFCARTQMVRRYRPLDLPGHVTYAFTQEWEDRYLTGTWRRLSLASQGGKSGTTRWEIEQLGAVTPSTSTIGLAYDWERGYTTGSDRHYRFHFPQSHHRLARLVWDDRWLAPISVRELDELDTSWQNDAGQPRYWMRGLGRARSIEVYEILTPDAPQYAILGTAGLSRRATGDRTYAVARQDPNPNVGWAYTTETERILLAQRPGSLSDAIWAVTHEWELVHRATPEPIPVPGSRRLQGHFAANMTATTIHPWEAVFVSGPLLAGDPSGPGEYGLGVKGFSGLVGYWRLGEAAGSTAQDATFNRYSLTDSDSAEITRGVTGAVVGDTAYTFSGAVGGFCSRAFTSALNPSALTVACWALATGGSGTTRRTVSSFVSAEGGWTLFVSTADQWRFDTYEGGVGAWGVTAAGFLENVWMHVVATHDSSGNSRLYQNGVLVSGPTSRPFDSNLSGNFAIAAHSNGSDRWTGQLDEIGVWNRALTADEVLALYRGGNPPGRRGLYAWERNWQPDGTVARVTDPVRVPTLSGVGWRATTPATTPSDGFCLYAWEVDHLDGSTLTTGTTSAGTATFEAAHGAAGMTLALGTIRQVSSPDRQYLGLPSDPSAVRCTGRIVEWRSSADSLFALEVVLPETTLQEYDVPVLIPQPLLKYIRYYVWARAFARPGEARIGILADHYARRFFRGVTLFQRLGTLSHRDRVFIRQPTVTRAQRPPRVQLPPEFPRVV
jgi:hypothetical protein